MEDLRQTKEDLATLQRLRRALPADAPAYWRVQFEVQSLTARAWIAQAEGREEEALALMRSAADLEDGADKLPVTPGEILPARELLADMLLEQHRPRQAVEEYDAVLRAAPNRFNALFGAGTAAERMGDRARARAYYEALVAQSELSEGGRPALGHARGFLSDSAGGDPRRP